MYFDFANVIVFVALALVLCGLMLGLGLLLRPANPNPNKLSTYEGGDAPRGRGGCPLHEVGVFIGILAIGLVYVWVKGDLEWLKRLPVERRSEATPARRA